MKESHRQQFRWAPHVSGTALLKPRDYEPGGEVQALNFYDAWAILRGSPSALDIGDALETGLGELRICKYVGFEEARWAVVETKSDSAPEAPQSCQSAAIPAA